MTLSRNGSQSLPERADATPLWPEVRAAAAAARRVAQRAVIVLSALLVADAAIGWLHAESPQAEQTQFFESKVRPLLVEKCHKCHGGERQKGGLRLDSREAVVKGGESGPVIVPGKPDQSELVRAIRYEADGFQMPPTGKLDGESIAVLTEWVRMGAPWGAAVPPAKETPAGKKTPAGEESPKPSVMNFAERARHWSLQPLRATRPPASNLPAANRSARSFNPVDEFLAARLAAAGLEPGRPADRRTLLRRVSFDLIGLPPTRAEIAGFLDDASPNAYEKVVERLLASPHYGERWGRHWLDLVRYAETYGHEFDYEINSAWPYRDYVVRAVNADLPYDQFVTEHVAGDLLSWPRRSARDGSNESVIGTAFWWFGQAKHSPVDIRAEECDTIDNQIDVFGKTFFGLTLACARCHDHKFDAIRAQDYYAMAGFLQSSRQQLAILDDPAPDHRFAEAQRVAQPRLAGLLAQMAQADAHRGELPPPDSTAADASDVLFAWNALGSTPGGTAFANRRAALARDVRSRIAAFGQRRLRDMTFADFAGDRFDGWNATGAAFGRGPSRAGDFVPGTTSESPVETFAPRGAAHSGLVSPLLRGTIRSPTFEITKPYIHYRAARRAAGPGLLQAYKTGQLNLIVDGFQIVRDPLYGNLTLTIPSGEPLAWFTQDVSKFQGSRAYIEIADEDDGWIAVDSIVFSDARQSPGNRPNELAALLLDDATIDDREKLTRGYARLVRDTLDLWRSGQLARDPLGADRVPLLRWLFRRPFDPRATGRYAEIASMLADRHRAEQALPPRNRVVAMTDGSPENEHVLLRGNHRKPGDEVPRRFLEAFGGHTIPPGENGSGRKELAWDMTHSGSSLLARVLVNRLWHHHFGRGIVASPDDFGKMGQPPSHPELLDYLAAELIRSGWSIKHMQRLLVLSSAYRLSSEDVDPKAIALDTDDRLLYKMRVRRLEAEAIRDAILAVSGRLDSRMEGPSVPVHLDEFMNGRGRPAISGPLDGNGRRSIYLAVRRNFLTPMFLAFDYPTPFSTAGRRGTSNVPAQALTLMNNPFILLEANVWARRLLASPDGDAVLATFRQATPGAQAVRDGHSDDRADGDTDRRIRRLYESAFGRLPSDEELRNARGFLAGQIGVRGLDDSAQAWTDLCHVLINVKEFIYIN